MKSVEKSKSLRSGNFGTSSGYGGFRRAKSSAGFGAVPASGVPKVPSSATGGTMSVQGMTKGLEPSINTAKAGNRKTLDLNKLITQGNRLLAAGKDTQAKDLIERALKQHGFEDATLHFQCGLANMNLGYLLYAQNMFERAIAFNASSIEGPNSQIDLLAYTQLGYTFKLQEQSD